MLRRRRFAKILGGTVQESEGLVRQQVHYKGEDLMGKEGILEQRFLEWWPVFGWELRDPYVLKLGEFLVEARGQIRVQRFRFSSHYLVGLRSIPKTHPPRRNLCGTPCPAPCLALP